MARRPNNFIKGRNIYNTEFRDPAESDYDSDSTFVVSDNSEERSASDDDDSVVVRPNDASNNEVMEIEARDDIVSPVSRRRRQRSLVNTILSDDEGEQEASEDQSDDGEIILSRKRNATGGVTGHGSSGTYAIDGLPSEDNYLTPTSTRPKYHDINPRKRRPNESGRPEREAVKRNLLNEYGYENAAATIRKSERLVRAEMEKQEAKRKRLEPLLERRKEMLEHVARNSFVEQPEEAFTRVVDNPTVPVVDHSGIKALPTNENLELHDVFQISALSLLNDGEVVDICGRVVVYGDMECRTRRDGTGDVEYRRIQVQDITGVVKITFWKDTPRIENELKISEGDMLVIKKLKKSTFNGEVQLCTMSSTVFKMFAEATTDNDGIVNLRDLDEIEDKKLVSIRGKVVQYGEEDTRPVRQGSTIRVNIRQIVLQDGTGFANVTLWRDFVTNESVQLNSFITMRGLLKITFGKTNESALSTTRYTVIEKFVAPANMDSNWELFVPSIHEYKIQEIDPSRIFVYKACGKCFKKVADAENCERVYSCPKCGTECAGEDIDVGIVMRIVTEEIDQFYTIFTNSVRKLCPTSLPIKWGHRTKTELEGAIAENVQEILPVRITCTEQTMGTLEIRRVFEN